jgi:lincosamide nucleotidyltransferase A/C/D/E
MPTSISRPNAVRYSCRGWNWSAGGFEDVEADDRTEWNFVMGTRSAKQIDFHVIEITGDGRGVYGPVEERVFYPASALAATGTVGGREVRCISAEFQVRSSTEYEPQEKDFADVRALCRRFGIPLPPKYR